MFCHRDYGTFFASMKPMKGIRRYRLGYRLRRPRSTKNRSLILQPAALKPGQWPWEISHPTHHKSLLFGLPTHYPLKYKGGIDAGWSPIGYEGVANACKPQVHSRPLWSCHNFVGYSHKVAPTKSQCCSADLAQWNARLDKLGFTKFQFQLLLSNFAFGSHALNMANQFVLKRTQTQTPSFVILSC